MKLAKLGNNETEVQINNDVTVFFSYNTPVAAHISGEGYYRTSKKWSVTTSKHINKWIDGPAVERDQSFFDTLAEA